MRECFPTETTQAKHRKMLSRSACRPGCKGVLLGYQSVTRYLDLVAHQRIRAFLDSTKLLDEQEIMNRIGSSAAIVGNAQHLERLSNLHWTLVFLLQNQGWQGKCVIVEKRERYSIALIPEIALETRISSQQELSLNQELIVRVTSVDLPGLTAHFTIV